MTWQNWKWRFILAFERAWGRQPRSYGFSSRDYRAYYDAGLGVSAAVREFSLDRMDREPPWSRNPDVTVSDPAAVLGIPQGAPKPVILDAFRKLARKLHPDRGGDPHQFSLVNKAYQLAMAGEWGGEEIEGGEQAPGRATQIEVPPSAARFVIVDEKEKYKGSARTLDAARKKQHALARKHRKKSFGIIDTGE